MDDDKEETPTSDRAACRKAVAERAGWRRTTSSRAQPDLEPNDLQDEVDRGHEALDRYQVALDRDQAALDSGCARSGDKPQRGQAALDREQAALDRKRGILERTQAKLDRMAGPPRDYLIDELTGLLRRDPGLRELDHEIDRARRHGYSLVVAFLDVDGLKTVNDDQGHAAGDRLLRAVADSLRRGLRSYDLLLRYGGDEFVCALSDTDIRNAERRLGEVAGGLKAVPGRISVSWGLAELRSHETRERLVARADAALYAFRRQQRARFVDRGKRPTPGKQASLPNRSVDR